MMTRIIIRRRPCPNRPPGGREAGTRPILRRPEMSRNPTLFLSTGINAFRIISRSGDLLCAQPLQIWKKAGNSKPARLHHFPVASSGGWILIIVVIS